MRLIDADKLKNIVEVSARLSDFLGRQLNDDKTAEIFRMATDGFIKQIDAEPTIEAIPVGWIKKWIADHYDWDFVSMQKYREPVEYMLKDWAEQGKEE